MATDLWLAKTPAGLLEPSSDEDAEILKTLTVGEIGKFTFTRPRNGKHHRKGMKLLQYVFENQDQHTVFKHFLIEVKIATGLVTPYITSDGQLIYIVGSISFDKMDEAEFCQWKNEAVNQIFNRFIPQMDQKDIDRVVANVMGFL